MDGPDLSTCDIWSCIWKPQLQTCIHLFKNVICFRCSQTRTFDVPVITFCRIEDKQILTFMPIIIITAFVFPARLLAIPFDKRSFSSIQSSMPSVHLVVNMNISLQSGFKIGFRNVLFATNITHNKHKHNIDMNPIKQHTTVLCGRFAYGRRCSGICNIYKQQHTCLRDHNA